MRFICASGLSIGLRYPRVGGRGFCSGAEKREARKMLLNRAESHT
jgi:hypothetical protein